MRDKEEETDYRFLPEPNLPTLKVYICDYIYIYNFFRFEMNGYKIAVKN